MKPEKVALRYVGREQTIHGEEQRASRAATTKLLSDAAFGGTWRGPKQPGRRFGPPPAQTVTRLDRIEPVDQRAREDRYRRQTGRINQCPAEFETSLDFLPASRRAYLLGLTPKQRRRSEKKAWHGDLVLRGLTT